MEHTKTAEEIQLENTRQAVHALREARLALTRARKLIKAAGLEDVIRLDSAADTLNEGYESLTETWRGFAAEVD